MEKLMVSRIKLKLEELLLNYLKYEIHPFNQPKISVNEFNIKGLNSDFEPVFFLSTGRTGTKLFTSILSKDRNNIVEHAPSPELIFESKEIFNLHEGDSLLDKNIRRLIFSLLFQTRKQYFFRSVIHGKRYIETNNRITFFAPLIKEFIPNAKFVFIHRHPGEFVRSGLRRGWYSGNHDHDIGRITMQSTERWSELNDIQRISWLWNETNMFIDGFLKDLKSDDYIVLNFNEINTEKVEEVINFIGSKGISKKHIKNCLGSKINAQRAGSFPAYENWADKDRSELIDFCGVLARKYGYEL
ncbi:sulfotransferase [Robertkochia aurantiaca]|uniref:sulfotransferase n=1 Tax=Robertkochia aurantiaca TaxID=2873700 RepID=UPI001CCBE2EB|nr:sulfotransferase [Robertkochia sp. 3YJGBD-33]